MKRSEHLAWCKKRALEYVDNDSLHEALSSMISDLSKHDETKNHAAIEFGVDLRNLGMLNSKQEMRKFIEGFN